MSDGPDSGRPEAPACDPDRAPADAPKHALTDEPAARDIAELGEQLGRAGIATPVIDEAGELESAREFAQGSGGYRRLLANHDFRALWVSQFVSGIGDWLVIGFLIPLVTQLSGGSSMAVAGLLIAKIIPALVFSSLIGVFVDRFDRRRTMIAMDLIRAVLTFGLLITDSLWVIYGVVLLMEMASMFFTPARNALIPLMVEERDLASANGLTYVTQQGSMLVGLSMSGIILAAFEGGVALIANHIPPEWATLLTSGLAGPKAGVLLNSVTFLYSAWIIWRISATRYSQARPEVRFDASLIGRDIMEAFRLINDHRELRGFLLTLSVGIFGGGAIVTVGMEYVRDYLSGIVPFSDLAHGASSPVGNVGQTFMLLFLATGMVAGAVIVPKLAEYVSLQQLFVGGTLVYGFGMLIFAWVTQYWVAAVFAVGAGIAIAAITVASNTYVGEQVADELRGRVFTALESAIRVALLASMIVLAPIGDGISQLVKRFADPIHPGVLVLVTGTRATLVLSALIVIGAGVYAAVALEVRPRRRNGVEEIRPEAVPATEASR